MAVNISEKKNLNSFFAFLGWLIIVVIIAGAAYYIFFKRPDKIAELTPSDVTNIQYIKKIQRDPDTIINSPEFQARRPYVSPLELIKDSFGKQYPFAPFAELIELQRSQRQPRK